MAGTIPGFGPQFVRLDDGRPAAAARLFVYEANSSVAADVYSDSALSDALSNPVVADANGFIPQFWVADGNYRCRLVTAVADGGSIIADASSIAAIGASDGGGGGGSTPETFVTGMILPWTSVGLPSSDWLFCNGETIGSASSGATGLASATAESLYTHLYNAFQDFVCTVSGGRGASAAADWAANKPMALPDLRGRAIYGLDDMGNTAAGRITSTVIAAGGATTLGSYGGAQTHTLVEAETPIITPAGTIATSIGGNVGGNTLPVSVTQPGYSAGGGTAFMGSSQITASITATSTFTGTAHGSGGAHNNMAPFSLLTYIIRL